VIFLSVGLRPDFPFGLVFLIFCSLGIVEVAIVAVGDAGGDCSREVWR
jgi:hypothetical protein